ncbi:MAG TPA: DUF1772 domain-containing protein [Pseudonocardiaceae bacterium]|jgi:uncharacterized membrane protein|nr:DUF1772 domain-containing protein [Pseudonocardiaceae bacterium]
MGTASFVVLVGAVVAAGLAAGLFYAYTCSVMPGLARGDDRTFVEGMRGIDVAIVNGWFLLSFLGAPLLAAVAGFLHPRPGPVLWWTVAGFGCLLAMLVVTGVVHIPLNNALDAGRVGYTELRARFERPWVRWNTVRTVLAIAGFGCLVGALVSRARA